MNIQILKELNPYSFFELQKMFSADTDEMKNILKTLSIMNIVKTVSKDTIKIELEELFQTDTFEEPNTQIDENMYKFQYVGILVVGDLCLIVYPKYANKYQSDCDNSYKILRQLILVIRKYHAKEQKLGVGDYLEIDNFNILSIALELISNYHEYGLYNNDMQIIEQNGDGEILWEKTISENTVYFSNRTPLYLDTFTINQENNEQDFFRSLHAFVITEVCNKLEDIFRIIDIDYINISSEKKENFGTKEYILYRLNQELSTQFVTHKQNTLKIIKRYIEEDTSKTISDNISFVGTTNFNLVWEDVCSVVMDDCINKSIKELGLRYSQNNKQSALLSDVIAKPKWIHDASGHIHKVKKTLVPDIISIKGNQLSIYDAKYYKIKLNENEVKDQPGVGDLTKQYLYELAYREFAQENNLVIGSNAFLMPTDENEEKKIGTASMEIFHNLGDINLKDIDVILKPCEKMYKTYLER